ncbi:hypothetical protein BVRB_6g136700 [Beta vulgaris subsp. vulgaris]|nr:hypothetical protein BVRB_6g136700 [Beta vulgaris subsp. vulgaris]
MLLRLMEFAKLSRFEEAITAAQKAAQLSANDKEARTVGIRTRSVAVAVAVARSKGIKLFQELKLK